MTNDIYETYFTTQDLQQIVDTPGIKEQYPSLWGGASIALADGQGGHLYLTRDLLLQACQVLDKVVVHYHQPIADGLRELGFSA
jgi:hypothetical protein